MIDYLAEIKQFHAEFVQPYTGKPKGCRDSEVRKIEDYFGLELPLAYKQYLKFMGKDYNGVFIGSNWFVGNVIENTEWLPQFLVEKQIEFKLPERFLVFFSHQENSAGWFDLPAANDDPPIWLITESNSSPRSVETFTGFLFRDMKTTALVFRDIYGIDGKPKNKTFLDPIFNLFKRR
jgi:hypothetical protein